MACAGEEVNNLEIVGASSLVVGLTTGLNLEFEGVDDRDAVYECMVSMLEKIPPSPGEEVHAPPTRASPRRCGWDLSRSGTCSCTSCRRMRFPTRRPARCPSRPRRWALRRRGDGEGPEPRERALQVRAHAGVPRRRG